MKKRVLSLLIVLCLVFALVPAATASEMSHSIVITPQYEEVGRFSNGYAPVKLNGKWGYINEAGDLVVEPKYDWAGDVSEGIAVTLVLGDCEDGFGEIVQGYYAHLIDMNGMDKPLYWREDHYYEDGECVTFPLIIGDFFDEFFWWHPNCKESDFFANSHLWICNDGIVNIGGFSFTATGERIDVQNSEDYGFGYPDFNQTGPAVNGIIPMQVTEVPYDMCDAMLIDPDGNVLFYSSEYSRISAPWEGMLMAQKRIIIEGDDGWWTEEERFFGLIDENYNWIAEPQFLNYMYTLDGVLFHDNLMPVQLKSGKWGAINTYGELVIDAQYDAMSCFSNGFSCVIQDESAFFIDTAGNPYTILDFSGNPANITLSSKVSTKGLAAVYDQNTNKAYYVNLLAAHDGVVPVVPGSDCLGLESYIDSFGEDGTPESIAIPSEFVPIKEGEQWGFVAWSFATTVNPFTDVLNDAFYYDPVLWALENGITSGATPSTFNPNGKCLRAQVVTFLHRAAGNPEPTRANTPFTDVNTSDFFYKPVLWAVDNSITSGISATQFGSYHNCNRAAVVTFLWRAAGSPEPVSTANPFTDVKTTDFFYKPVLWAVENNITAGLTATTFGPTAECNRAQVVTFLYRAYN